MAELNVQPEKKLSLLQATAVNMIDMVGIGPFVTTSMIVSYMNGPMALLAWVLGAVLSFMDGMVWAEMGSRWPAAGGSYVFLRKLYEPFKAGALMSFLFIWQTTIQAPLVIASGALGFSKYLSYLIDLTATHKKLAAIALIALIVLLLYRNIKNIGRISVLLWIITGGTILWLIFSGLPHFHLQQVTDWHTERFSSNDLFYTALGMASLKSVYSYLGYYNVCHLGAEIKNPQVNIPRTIMISIGGITFLYLSMQVVILGVLPWETIKNSEFVGSLYFQTIYGSRLVGEVATVLILIVAGASLFSATLGYSRIPYAAAERGDFFPIFGKLHPRLEFPYVSLLILSAIAMVLAVSMDLKETIAAILVIRIPVQFIAQAVGLIMWRSKIKNEPAHFKMSLFPIPAIISIILWIYIFTTQKATNMAIAGGVIGTGIIVFFIKEKLFGHPENKNTGSTA